MTLKEFIRKVQTSPVLRDILPMDQGMLYPAFSITREKLCVHFLAHRTAVTAEGLQIWPPELYFQFTYPHGALLTVRTLAFDPDFSTADLQKPTLLPNRSPEEKEEYKKAMQRLIETGDSLLSAWDEAAKADVSAYNRALKAVLLPEQEALYNRLMGQHL